MCSIDVLSDSSIENSSELFDANNLQELSSELRLYNNKIVLLYNGNNTKFGNHTLNGNWEFISDMKRGLHFGVDKSYTYDFLPTSSIATEILFFGVSEDATKLYFQDTRPRFELKNELTDGNIYDYIVIEIIEVLNEHCYLVDGRDLFTKAHSEGNIVEFCKE